MQKLLIATYNKAKFSEIKDFLSDLPVKLVSLKDLAISEDIEEDGKTFEENALKKAEFYCQKTGLPTLADDGGIEIDYLDGEPGVHSRRWIDGKRATDEELITFTLESLKNVPYEKRGAQLRAALALVFPDGTSETAEGKIRGVITDKPYNEARLEGFPFRSLFFIPEIKKFYNPNEMTKEETIKYNHRGRALLKIKKLIREKYA